MRFYMTNPLTTAVTVACGTAPATFSAAWAAFGLVAPELVLPLTLAAMAFTGFGAGGAAYFLDSNDEVSTKMIGEVISCAGK